MSRKILPVSAVIALVLYLIYLGGMFLVASGSRDEVYISATEQVELEALRPVPEDPGKTDEALPPREGLFRDYALEAETLRVSSFVSTNMLSFVGLINRTAFSSICYPIIFPRYLDYYPLDLGLDMLGLGVMPDDAVTIYAILNPQNPNGSMAAPFFTVLYSQGGLAVAWIGALIVGFCFGLFWSTLLRARKIGVCGAALGGQALFFALSLAMAGGRDSLLSSYGVVWPVITLCAFYFACWLISHRRRANIPEKRICMLVTSGVINDSRVIREATVASGDGFEVTVIGRHIPELGEEDPAWKFSVKRIRISRAEGTVLQKIIERIRLGLTFTAQTVRLRPDVIHCNDFDTLPFGFMAAVICDSGLVYDSHELWSENLLVADSALGKRLVRGIERFLAVRCDAVISVSNAGAAWFRETYGLKNVTVVTNCPYSYSGSAKEKETAFTLLNHGMFAPDRGYEETIDCASLVEPHGICVDLRGYGALLDMVREKVSQSEAKNLRLLPKVPPGQVVMEATSAHVGAVLTKPVTISFERTVSNKLFEYINAGLPVILSNVAEHRYLNELYNFGLIIEEVTPEQIAAAVIRLKTDEALYRELAENARAASKELCFEREGQKLLAVYHAAAHDEEESANETDLIEKRSNLYI